MAQLLGPAQPDHLGRSGVADDDISHLVEEEAIGSAECVHGVIGPGKAVCCSARGAGANRPPGRVQCGLGPNEGLYKRFPGPSILL